MNNTINPFVLLVVATMLVFGCSSDDGEGDPNLSGVWAGTWQGEESPGHKVSGNWEAEIGQTLDEVSGVFTLDGDIDCTDGDIYGWVVRDTNNSRKGLEGTMNRPPCFNNRWAVSSLDRAGRSVSGNWDQVVTGAVGSFTGTQIAVEGGPRISFLHPRSGGPGAKVNIVGTGFYPDPGDNVISIGDEIIDDLSVVDETTLVATMPHGADSGTLALRTPDELALSPYPFNADPGFPSPEFGSPVDLGKPASVIAASPDDRRIFAAAVDPLYGGLYLYLVDTATGTVINSSGPISGSTADKVTGLDYSPNGRLVYLAQERVGVHVIHPNTLTVIDTFPAHVGIAAETSLQGLAATPDGRSLYLSDNETGGNFVELDRETGLVVSTIPVGPDETPKAVRVAPSGREVYLAVAKDGGDGHLLVYDPETVAISAAPVPTGAVPVSLATTKAGDRLYVVNAGDGTVSGIDLDLLSVVETIPVGDRPSSITLSPDDTRAYVTNIGDDTVSVILLSTGEVIDELAVTGEPVFAAITPDGKRGFVARRDHPKLAKLSTAHTLTVIKQGSGYGTVTTTPSGLSCGNDCRRDYDEGTILTLTAHANSNSRFTGWSGDADCADGVVEMNENKQCVATFNYSGQSSSGGGGCFLETLDSKDRRP